MKEYVFGYASLVGLRADSSGDVREAPQPGRLYGFRRYWGVAMNNWEGEEGGKHFLDPETGERPRIRVAYLDLYTQPAGVVNGLALPVDAERLAALDAREVNYKRVEVTRAFEPPLLGRVFTYVGLPAARVRCRQGTEAGDVFVSSAYASSVRHAFKGLAPDALDEYERTTDPCPFPERELRVVPPRRASS